MRRRKPHTIVRLEFPKKYLSPELRPELDFAISCVAWQHELGTKVPHVQEFADLRDGLDRVRLHLAARRNVSTIRATALCHRVDKRVCGTVRLRGAQVLRLARQRILDVDLRPPRHVRLVPPF